MVATNVLPVRERIIAQIEKKLRRLHDDQGTNLFKKVMRAPVSDKEVPESSFAVIMDLGDRKDPDGPAVHDVADYFMSLSIFVVYRPKQNEIANKELNKLIAFVQKEMVSDYNLIEDVTNQPLAIEVMDDELTFTIDRDRDDSVDSAVLFTIRYRRRLSNPFLQI